VISVPPTAPVGEVAALLRDRRIGGVPVIAEGRLLGIIAEADLIHRHEIGTDAAGKPRHWWQLRREGAADAAAYVRSHGGTARHVMTRRVHVLQPSAPLGDIASLLAAHRIGRAPVVSEAGVVGMVAQADLVRALAERSPATVPACTDDDAIGRALLAELSANAWWSAAWATVYVEGGVVIFKGVVDNEFARAAARVAAENIPGVKGILDDRVLSADLREMT
jgi:CBS domain-containing protein